MRIAVRPAARAPWVEMDEVINRTPDSELIEALRSAGEGGGDLLTVDSRGRATWDECLLLFLERSSYEEETYHTLSYSPLANEEGAVALNAPAAGPPFGFLVVGMNRYRLLRPVPAPEGRLGAGHRRRVRSWCRGSRRHRPRPPHHLDARPPRRAARSCARAVGQRAAGSRARPLLHRRIRPASCLP